MLTVFSPLAPSHIPAHSYSLLGPLRSHSNDDTVTSATADIQADAFLFTSPELWRSWLVSGGVTGDQPRDSALLAGRFQTAPWLCHGRGGGRFWSGREQPVENIKFSDEAFFFSIYSLFVLFTHPHLKTTFSYPSHRSCLSFYQKPILLCYWQYYCR